jgi:hypothetical protein
MIFSGCSNKPMSKQTYDKIQNGMLLSEVDKLMDFDQSKFNNSGLQYSNDITRMVLYDKNDPSSQFTVIYFIAEKNMEIRVKVDEGKVITKNYKGL